jgi:dihydrofolate synthase / folylpolyglutamate synthase
VTAPREWIWSLETLGIKLGLDAMRALLEALDHPDRTFRSIIVAGTNGKGSVTAMIERGLRAAGCRTGRYTSPHLTQIEERIAINGTPIEAAAFDRAAARVQDATGSWATPPSFFEATTALALEAFRAAHVEIAVLEVGLGGRLDATNVVAAPLAVITRIGLDHQEYLGHTLAAIAREKAGVIAPGARVVVAPNPPEARTVVAAVAAAQGARMTGTTGISLTHCRADASGTLVDLVTPGGRYGDVRIALPGAHQVENAQTALCALQATADLGWITCTEDVLRAAVGEVEWPARLEWRRYRACRVLVDGAHNADGANALANYLETHVREPFTLVIGVMRDKAVEDIVRPLLARAERVVTTAVATPRALPADQLGELCARLEPGVPVEVATSTDEALRRAAEYRRPILIAGSLYLAGHVRPGLA